MTKAIGHSNTGEDKGPVTHPNHYNRGGMEVMDIQEAYGVNPVDYWRGNAIKYILRAPFKGSEITDYKKCIQCLTYLLAKLGDNNGK